MSGEKVPMCADNYDDETKDLGDVNKSQKAQRVGDDGTTTGDNENEDANLPPNGRVMGGTSASVSNEFTHSFEGGKHIVAESASGRIIKDSSANEKIYRGSN